MTVIDQGGRIFLAALCLIVLLLGVPTGIKEFYAVVGSGLTDASKFQTLVQDRQVLAPSSQAMKTVLGDCYVAMAGVFGKLRPVQDQKAVRENCLSTALAITSSTPVNSYAWLVAAKAASGLENYADLNLYLSRSRETGPNESWLASLRTELAEANFDLLGEGNRAAYVQDVGIVLEDQLAREALARRFALIEGARPVILAAVESQSEVLQSRFLDAVRRAGVLISQ